MSQSQVQPNFEQRVVSYEDDIPYENYALTQVKRIVKEVTDLQIYTQQ